MDQPVLSVKDIVGIWTKKKEELWRLALVQRDFVWDEYRIGKLLDSLLKNYPIGMLLLCKTTQNTSVLDSDGKLRIATAAGQSWQLLDGQQRTLALATLFSTRVSSPSRFYLHMSKIAPDLDVSGRDKHLREYIDWETDTQSPGASPDWDRTEWLDLGKFGDFLIDHPEVEAQLRSEFAENDDVNLKQTSAGDILRRLHSIDNQFQKWTTGNEHIFKKRVQDLLLCWADRRIPIHRVTLASAQEILQVFGRVNQEGIKTTATDIFFAGVKTQWNDAEECLDEAAAHSRRVFNRLSMLRLAARLASYEEQKQDIIPLDLKRLKRTDGRKIIDRMRAITQHSERKSRMQELSDFLIDKSGLGSALAHVDDHLLDHAYCWAMNNRNLNSCNLMDVATYLIAGTAFRLYPVFRDTFSRLGFDRCYEEGISGSKFPLTAILHEVKDRWPQLRYSRSAIPPTSAVEDQRMVVRQSPYLFLSIAQNLLFELPRGKKIEWDHIYAQALDKRMKWKGPQGIDPKKHYHEDYSYIWKVGNMCALNSSLNESLRDSRPEDKLKRLDVVRLSGQLWPVELFISEEEQRLLLQADLLLEEDKIAEAMLSFRKFVESREDRMWQESVTRFPQISDFQTILSLTPSH